MIYDGACRNVYKSAKDIVNGEEIESGPERPAVLSMHIAHGARNRG